MAFGPFHGLILFQVSIFLQLRGLNGKAGRTNSKNWGVGRGKTSVRGFLESREEEVSG